MFAGWLEWISRSWIRLYLFLLVIGVIFFANSWGNELFWDDLDNFVNNRYVHSWEYFGNYFSENLIAGSGLASNYWRPMMLLVWSVCWSFWQDWGGGYRIINLLLHVGCGVLVYQILRKLFDKKWLALIVSVIFVIHPLQTEAITYASGISDPLAGVFILGSIFSYLKFRLDNWKRGWLLAVILMTGGLMSRETVVVLPAIIGAIEVWLFLDKRVERTWSDWFKKVVWLIGWFGVVSGIYLYLRGTILNFGGTFNIYQEENEFTQHPEYRLLTFWKVLSLFIGVLIVPIGLHMDRLITIEKGFTNPLVVIGGGLMVLSIILVIIGIRNFEKWRIAVFGIGWFWIWLFPVSNLVIPVNGLMYEHWMYLPMIGFWTVIVWTYGAVLNSKKFYWVKVLLLGLALVWFGVLTIYRNTEWAGATSFYKQVLGYNPTSLRVWNNLGMTYANRGQLDEAMPIYQKAASLDPVNWVPLHNIGNAYKGKGQYDLALEYYLKALDKNPNSFITINMLLQMLISNKEGEKAGEVLKGLIVKNPRNQNMVLAIVELAIQNKDRPEAEKYFDLLDKSSIGMQLTENLKSRIGGIQK